MRPRFVSRVRDTLRRFSMIDSGDRVMVAVSGGADSLALLDALNILAKELGATLAVAHVDHQLRPDSEADAARVREVAGRLRLPYVSRTIRVRPRGSREAAARDGRWAALREMARVWEADRIAVGHTATDRAETMLLFATRGAGRRGMGSMVPSTEAGVIRPLCEVTRKEARGYAEARGLPFADDPTNDDETLSRNRIRARVLPALRGLNPSADRSLAAAAQELAEEDALLDDLAGAATDTLVSRRGDVLMLEAADLDALALPLRRRVVRRMFAEVSPGGQTGRRHVEAVLGLLVPGAREVHLPGALAWRDGRKLCFGVRRPDRRCSPECVRVEHPGLFRPRQGIEFEVELLDRCSTPLSRQGTSREGGTAGRAWFDTRSVRFPLWIRGARPGDRLELEGGGRQKVAQRLAEAGVPPSLRPEWLVLCDGSGVLWVPGVRQGARGRPDDGTRQVIQVEVRGLMFADPYANQVEERVRL